MAVSTIALYASPSSSVCSAPHQRSINAISSIDCELNSRSTPSASTAPSSSSQRSIVGGLSCLFSSPTVKYASTSYSPAGEDLGSYRGEELSSSFCYSSSKFSGSFLKSHPSPVSVLQGPVSCSPPMRITREKGGDVSFSGSFRGGASGLFNRFVRNALGSCVDYDSASSEVNKSGIVDELTFNMDETLMDSNLEPYAKELLSNAQSRHKIFSEELVVKAFYEAEKAHRGQMRASGDPYLQHCVETAVLLALIGANSTMVAAGLLHDSLDDSFLSYDYILRTFNAGVADLVEGVSKLSHISKLARENNTACKTVEADRLHTMFLAMTDARAVLIKLADRLHNMMTLDSLPLFKQQRFARETLEIFVPLTNRLGISSWKEQLENLCFKHLNPNEHKKLSARLERSFDEAMVASAMEKLEGGLNEEAIPYYVVSGRHKSLYSIYRKMLKKSLTMDEIHDIHGLRIIVKTKEDCYNALRVVHKLWSKVPGKRKDYFKDYIVKPKLNGYQSLHTVVMGEDMVRFEVQIRTMEMHLQAECGFAAHWRYKEADCKHSPFVLQVVEWVRWVLAWQCEAMNKDQSSFDFADSIKPPGKFPSHSEDCPFCFKPNSDQDGPVMVILINENNEMTVHEIPAGSTMMDLIEKTGRGCSSKWSSYGFPIKEQLRPRLNHKPVSDPSCKLEMGDVVELTPAIPDKSLTEYREEIKRMYDRDTALTRKGPLASTN